MHRVLSQNSLAVHKPNGLYDLLVVGAGISGIAAAKFYLDIHPKCKLAILERDG